MGCGGTKAAGVLDQDARDQPISTVCNDDPCSVAQRMKALKEEPRPRFQSLPSSFPPSKATQESGAFGPQVWAVLSRHLCTTPQRWLWSRHGGNQRRPRGPIRRRRCRHLTIFRKLWEGDTCLFVQNCAAPLRVCICNTTRSSALYTYEHMKCITTQQNNTLHVEGDKDACRRWQSFKSEHHGRWDLMI